MGENLRPECSHGDQEQTRKILSEQMISQFNHKRGNDPS